MSTPGASLTDRHTDATLKLIVGTAADLLERGGVDEVTARAVAKAAGMSERTVFRYFASRDAFLDAVAAEVARRIDAPSPPASLEALRDFADPLYRRFEEKADLVKAALHTEISERMREGPGGERWRVVEALIDAAAPHRTALERKVATANVRYYLAATPWRYFRVYLGLSLEEAIAAARTAVGLILDDVCRLGPARR